MVDALSISPRLLADMHECLAVPFLQFCEGVAPGEANVKDCLELHM